MSGHIALTIVYRNRWIFAAYLIRMFFFTFYFFYAILAKCLVFVNANGYHTQQGGDQCTQSYLLLEQLLWFLQSYFHHCNSLFVLF